MTRPQYAAYLTFPFRIGEDGRTAQVEGFPQHVQDEIVQLILTSLGERVFQPRVGTNVRRLVFENIDSATKGLTKATVTRALNRRLGHRVTIEDFEVIVDESKLAVDVKYRLAGSEDSRTLRFQRSEL